MQRIAGIFGIVALLALPVAADPQWGGSGLTAQSPVGDNHQWRLYPESPHIAYLFRGNAQLGAWNAERQQYRPLLNYERGEWGEYVDKSPVGGLPPDMIREKKNAPGNFATHGVDVSQMCRHERYSISGSNVALADAENAIGKGMLPDDSAKLWFAVWSPDAAKRTAVIDAAKRNPEMAKFLDERCHVWAGDAANPNHFLAKDRSGQPLYVFDGDPLVTLQGPDGVELWHDAGFRGGPGSFDAIRKRDPNYKPASPASGDGGFNWWYIAAIVAGVVLLRRKG